MIQFLVDQNFNEDIVDGLTRRVADLPMIRVRDVGLAPASDPAILEWAAAHGLILLTHDRRTVPLYAHARVAAGLPMPGVFLVDNEWPVGQAMRNCSLPPIACPKPSARTSFITSRCEWSREPGTHAMDPL